MKRIFVVICAVLLVPMGMLNAQDVPIGTIIATIGPSSPGDDYLPMDGEYYSIDDYPELYAYITDPDNSALGDMIVMDTPGGDLYIYLPNLGARVLMGAGILSNDDLNTITDYGDYFSTYGPTYLLADYGGEFQHTLTVDEIPSHNHVQTGYYGGVGISSARFSVSATGGSGATSATVNALITGSTGGGVPHNNLQPYWTVSYWIKAETVTADMLEQEYVQTIEITDSQGNLHTAAFNYSMSAGDVLVSVLLLGVLLLGLFNKGQSIMKGKE